MEVETKPRRMRIVSEPLPLLEETLNRMLDDYAALVWNFQVVACELVGTVVLLHTGELRKAQLMARAPMGRPS